jgi:site-specific DNA recombinase
MRKPNTRPVRFAIYLRCSTDDQKYGDFTTIDTQRQINHEHVTALGGEVVGEYNDEGRTGTNLKRPDWKRLLTDAAAKKFDAVIVTYMSRLARGEVYHVAEYLLGESKVEVEMVYEDFTPDMAGQMNKNLKIFMDGMYPKQVSEWTKTKQAQMVKMGYHTGGVPTFGFCSEPVPGMTDTHLPGGKIKPAPRHLIPHPEQAPHILKAFELFAEFDNMGEVRRYLRREVPERNWNIERISQLLRNDRYIGVARFGEHVNLTAHEPIVPQETWDMVQALLNNPERRLNPRGEGWGEGRRRDPMTYYLKGRIYCKTCGCRMTPASFHGRTTVVSYYQCIRGTQTGTDCPVKRVNAGMLHAAILGEVQRCAEHPSRLIRLYESVAKNLPSPKETRDDIKQARRNQRETEKKIERIIEAIKVVGGSNALVLELRALEARRDEWIKRIKELEAAQVRRTLPRPDAATIAGLWSGFLERWAALSEEERVELLPLVVDRVDFSAKNEGAMRLFLNNVQDTETAWLPIRV